MMAIKHTFSFGLAVLACMFCVSVQAREIYGHLSDPLAAYRRFLESQEKRGAFAILNKAFASKFWDYYLNDAIHSFYPAGSPEEAQAFRTPWWLEDMPLDD